MRSYIISIHETLYDISFRNIELLLVTFCLPLLYRQPELDHHNYTRSQPDADGCFRLFPTSQCDPGNCQSVPAWVGAPNRKLQHAPLQIVQSPE
jgi:hypothetical protein